MKIGIFGGCFNPPHKMHYNIAKELINNGYLDKVIFVPTGDTYNKKGLVLHEKRVEMLKLMVDNVNIFVSDICKNGKCCYTYEIMDYYQYLYPNATLYFICGMDNLEWFDEWKRYEYILQNYKLLVIMRNKSNVEEIMKKYNEFRKNILIANINENPLSSTLIREHINRGRYEKLNNNLDKKVIEYIKCNELYKN